MPFFHGTTDADLQPGDALMTARARGRGAHPYAADGVVELRSGAKVHRSKRIWVCEDVEEAADWGAYACLKASEDDMRRMACGGIVVYEVDVDDVDAPVQRLSPTETTCARARVVRRAHFLPFAFDE